MTIADAPPRNRRAVAYAALALFACLFAVYRLSPVYQVSDSHYSMLLSQDLIQHGSLRMDRHFQLPLNPAQYPGFDPATGRPRSIERVGDHYYYLFPPASSILSAPFVGLMNLAGLSASNPDGTYSIAGELALQRNLAAFLTALTGVLFLLLAHELLPLSASIALAALAALGSQAWSVASRGMWTHTWSVLLATMLVWQLLRTELGRRKFNPYVVATMLSWLFFVRPPNSLLVVGVCLYVLFAYRSSFAPLAVTGAAWLALFLIHSKSVYGHWLPLYIRDQAARNMRIDGRFLAGVAGLLASPSRGLLIYLPALLPVLWLLFRHWRDLPSRRLAWLGLACGFSPVMIFAGYVEWYAGHCYGARYMTDSLPWFYLLSVLAVVGLRASGTSSAGRRVWLAGLGLFAVVGMFTNGAGALSWETSRWNAQPGNIQFEPERLWDISRPQFLAGLIPAPPPHLVAPVIPIPSGTRPLAVVDLRMRDTGARIEGFWPDPSPDFRWSTSPKAALGFALDAEGETVLRITTGFFKNPGVSDRERVSLSLNGRFLTELTLRDQSIQPYTIPVPAGWWRGSNILSLDLPDANSPDGSDPRMLGLSLQSIEVFALPAVDAAVRAPMPAAASAASATLAPVALKAAAGPRIDLRDSVTLAATSGFWPESDPLSRWTTERRVTILIRHDNPAAGVLKLVSGAFLVPGKLDRQRVRIAVNGISLPELEIRGAALETHSLPVPAGAWRGDNQISLELPDAASPMSLGAGNDPRTLGLALQSLEVTH